MKHKCRYCSLVFAHKSGKSRHQKTCLDDKPIDKRTRRYKDSLIKINIGNVENEPIIVKENAEDKEDKIHIVEKASEKVTEEKREREEDTEQYYQRILEKRHNAIQFHSLAGISDLTNDLFNGEIKHASKWRQAIRQLLFYNTVHPRPHMRLYLFNYDHLNGRVSETLIQAAKATKKMDIYILTESGEEICLYRN